MRGRKGTLKAICKIDTEKLPKHSGEILVATRNGNRRGKADVNFSPWDVNKIIAIVTCLVHLARD